MHAVSAICILLPVCILLPAVLPLQVVREGSRRVLGLRPFDVQLIGGMILHEGQIAEMRTGGLLVLFGWGGGLWQGGLTGTGGAAAAGATVFGAASVALAGLQQQQPLEHPWWHQGQQQQQQ